MRGRCRRWRPWTPPSWRPSSTATPRSGDSRRLSRWAPVPEAGPAAAFELTGFRARLPPVIWAGRGRVETRADERDRIGATETCAPPAAAAVRRHAAEDHPLRALAVRPARLRWGEHARHCRGGRGAPFPGDLPFPHQGGALVRDRQGGGALVYAAHLRGCRAGAGGRS